MGTFRDFKHYNGLLHAICTSSDFRSFLDRNPFLFGNCKRTEIGGTVLCASGQATGCLDESVERHLWICCAVLDDGGNHDDSCRRKESVRGF